MRPVGGDFEVGFIQNVVEFQAEWLYKQDGVDPSPKRVLITLRTLSCLDNKKGTVTVWSKDRPIQMGALPLKDPPSAPAHEDTGQIATDDTPGGQIPLIHPKDPDQEAHQHRRAHEAHDLDCRATIGQPRTDRQLV